MTKTRRKSEQRFARIKALQCHQEVYERLVAGYPPLEVARYVQDIEGEYLHVSRRSLAEMLRRYAAEVIAVVDLIAPHLPHVVVKAQKEFDDRLLDLRRLEVVYEALEYRLAIAHGDERRYGTVNPGVDRQVRVLMELVVKMHTIKLALGLTGERERGVLIPSPERLAEIKKLYGEGAARAFADPVQRAQVLGLLKRVLRLRDRTDAIDIESEQGDGGTSATACPDAIEEAPPRRADDYPPFIQGDDDGGDWESQ